MSILVPSGALRIHLLVVDDSVVELKLLLEALRGTGYRITLAFDAMEGYRRATTLQMDLVLLDVRWAAPTGSPHADC